MNMKQEHSDNLPKLVASDIGGTLLRGTSVLPEFTTTVLNRLVSRVPIALVTGFNYRTTLKYTRNLDADVLLMPQNGTLCVRHKEIVWEYRIPETAAKELHDYLRKNELPVILYKGKNERFSTYYIYKEEMPALAYAFKRLNSLNHFGNITGISTLLPDDIALQVRKRFKEIVGRTFEVIYTRETKGSWLEVVNKEVRKDLAIKRLCRELDIPLEDVVYFGDNFNDREALRLVGHPVLVENAQPELKKEFKTVIPSVYDEGVATYLNHLFELQL
jgi:Cof subfamily protein (haloacid dehalogenase superfamily)